MPLHFLLDIRVSLYLIYFCHHNIFKLLLHHQVFMRIHLLSFLIPILSVFRPKIYFFVGCIRFLKSSQLFLVEFLSTHILIHILTGSSTETRLPITIVAPTIVPRGIITLIRSASSVM